MDGPKVYAWVTEAMGPEAADKAVEIKATKASIHRMMLEYVPRGGRADMERSLYKTLERAGGITTKTAVTVRPVKVGKEEEDVEE